MISKEILEEYYIRKRLTLKQIGNLLDISDATVLRWMRKYNIPTRSKSEANKGKPKSEEHKKKLKASSFVRWSRKEEHEKTSKSVKKTMSDPVFRVNFLEAQRNRKPPRPHKKNWPKESCEKIGGPRREKTYEEFYGEEKASEIKRKQSKSREGKKLGPHSEKTKEKMSKSALLHIQNHSGPFTNTKPELKMKEILTSLNISFEHQYRLEHCLFDFHILNSNVLIEVDGDYYHSNPLKFQKLNKMQLKVKERDIKHNEVAKSNNFILLRFWEDDILNNTEEVKMKLKNLIGGENYGKTSIHC